MLVNSWVGYWIESDIWFGVHPERSGLILMLVNFSSWEARQDQEVAGSMDRCGRRRSEVVPGVTGCRGSWSLGAESHPWRNAIRPKAQSDSDGGGIYCGQKQGPGASPGAPNTVMMISGSEQGRQWGKTLNKWMLLDPWPDWWAWS